VIDVLGAGLTGVDEPVPVEDGVPDGVDGAVAGGDVVGRICVGLGAGVLLGAELIGGALDRGAADGEVDAGAVDGLGATGAGW